MTIPIIALAYPGEASKATNPAKSLMDLSISTLPRQQKLTRIIEPLDVVMRVSVGKRMSWLRLFLYASVRKPSEECLPPVLRLFLVPLQCRSSKTCPLLLQAYLLCQDNHLAHHILLVDPRVMFLPPVHPPSRSILPRLPPGSTTFAAKTVPVARTDLSPGTELLRLLMSALCSRISLKAGKRPSKTNLKPS